METKHRLALKHQSGLYLSWSPDEFPHTKRIGRARRFNSAEEIDAFMQTSTYAPERPEEYKVVGIKITYEEEEANVQQER